jgi:hypothetical protein
MVALFFHKPPDEKQNEYDKYQSLYDILPKIAIEVIKNKKPGGPPDPESVGPKVVKNN